MKKFARRKNKKKTLIITKVFLYIYFFENNREKFLKNPKTHDIDYSVFKVVLRYELQLINDKIYIKTIHIFKNSGNT
jgi:hypothetical protein